MTEVQVLTVTATKWNATKRIDPVVARGNDRRPVIQCDGDRYHRPHEWPDDTARRRMLERVGWSVWRRFASRFVRAPDAGVDAPADLRRAAWSPT